MSYQKYSINLTNPQKKKLSDAVKTKTAITLKIANKDLTGEIPLLLTKTQINAINKAKGRGTGYQLTLSSKQIENMVKNAGFLQFLVPLLMAGLTGLASGAAAEGGRRLVNYVADKASGEKKGSGSKSGGCYGGRMGRGNENNGSYSNFGATVGKGAKGEGLMNFGMVRGRGPGNSSGSKTLKKKSPPEPKMKTGTGLYLFGSVRD